MGAGIYYSYRSRKNSTTELYLGVDAPQEFIKIIEVGFGGFPAHIDNNYENMKILELMECMYEYSNNPYTKLRDIVSDRGTIYVFAKY